LQQWRCCGSCCELFTRITGRNFAVDLNGEARVSSRSEVFKNGPFLMGGEFRESDHLSSLAGKTPCGARGNQLLCADETSAAEQLNSQCVFEQMKFFFQAAFITIVKVRPSGGGTPRT